MWITIIQIYCKRISEADRLQPGEYFENMGGAEGETGFFVSGGEDLPYCGVEVMLVLVKCGLFSFKFLDCPLAVSEHAGNVQPSGIVWGLVGADF